MAYCDISHVQAHQQGRGPYTSSTKPTASQVAGFIDEAAAEIDIALTEGGYTLPIPASATTAHGYLQRLNAMGALCSVETAAQVSSQDDNFCSMYKSGLKRIAAGQRIPGLTKDAGTAMPRQAQPTPSPAFFTRDMQL